MRPAMWRPPIEMSGAEQAIEQRIRRAKLFVFLRHERHRLFSDAFQEELGGMFRDSVFGQPPIPPAQLALATILQAYTGVSDDEVIEATLMDRRWQLVLDCLDCSEAPFSKGTLVMFRQRLIAQDLDRRLIERTVEIAKETGGFGSRPLRAALDSSPLWGAGRVEDTYNLLGHALRKVLGVMARQRGYSLAQVARDAGAPMVAETSLKAALDLNWDDPEERALGLRRVLDALESVEDWLAGPSGDLADPTAQASLGTAQQVKDQDVVIDAAGKATLRQGVAKDRRISVEDPEMRHGRKSRRQLFDGYKRHVLHDLDTGLVRAVGVTAANAPEASVTDDLRVDLARQDVTLVALHIDRAYLSSSWVRERPPSLQIYCKAWSVHNGDHFPKTMFSLDWERRRIRCPQGNERPFEPGKVVHFPADICAACPKRAQCTQSTRGRSLSIHPDEQLIWVLRQQQNTTDGRSKLRERVGVEHTLSHVGYWQGPRARYIGIRKNLLDLRRCAVVHNLSVISHLPAPCVGSLTT